MSGLLTREAQELLATARTLTPAQQIAFRSMPWHRDNHLGAGRRAAEALTEADARWREQIMPAWDVRPEVFSSLINAMVATLAGDLISAADRSALLAPWESVMGS